MNSDMQALAIRTFWPGQSCHISARGQCLVWPNVKRPRGRGRATAEIVLFRQCALQLLDRRKRMLSLGRSKALAALGLVLTLVLATLALVTQTRPAQATRSALAPWSDSLAEYGMAASTTGWQPSNWDVQVHTRDRRPGDGIDPHLADHGADCG